MALASVLLAACGSDLAFVADESDEELSSSSSSSELEESPRPSCTPEAMIPGLPYALARRDEAGEMHLRVQSFPFACAAFDGGWDPNEVRIWLHVAADAVEETQLDLREVDAVAYLAAGAPGNASTVAELAWLDGELMLDASDDETIVGAIDDRTVPISGCFTARVCP